MTDTLTASMKWCRYDDDFREKNGYRLPAGKAFTAVFPFCSRLLPELRGMPRELGHLATLLTSQMGMLTKNVLDPYWLAPPQGSIVPLWHRGGAPNYQPKPMICKHVQDPIKAWRREKQKDHAGCEILKPVAIIKEPTAIAADQVTETRTTTHQIEVSLRRHSVQLFHGQKQAHEIEVTPRRHSVQLFHGQKQAHGSESKIQVLPRNQQTESFCQRQSLQLFQRIQKEVHSPANDQRRISVFFCSAGTTAEKLAKMLHRWLSSFVKDSSKLQLCSRSKPLNSLSASDLTVENILLLIISSTGQGEIPSNGLGIPKLCENISSTRLMDPAQSFKFAVFGNGDSRYSATYNGAAVKINDHLTQAGGYPLVDGIFQADTAMEPVPLAALKSWWNKLQPSIGDQPIESLQLAIGTSPNGDKHAAVVVSVTPLAKLGQKYEDYQDRLLSTLGEASLVHASPGMHEDGSLLVTFDVNDDRFEEMSCIQILPSNAPLKVNQALRSLVVKGSDHVDLGLDGRNPTYASFLTDYVDLELPFSDAECFGAVELASHGDLDRASLGTLPVQRVLERLHGRIIQMSDGQRADFIHDICQDMPLLHTRTYSIASSRQYPSSCNRANVCEVDIMVKVLPGGRFSETLMKDCAIPASLKYRIVDSPSGAILRKNHLRPFVIIATGAGFGPVRSLLQWRMGIIRDAIATGRPLPSRGLGITLFLGLKPSDRELVIDVLNEAMSLNLIDMLDIVLSNPMKHRIYDDLQHSPQHLRNKLIKREGMAFICSNKSAAIATKMTFENILGGPVEMLGERYVEEVF